MIFPMLSYAYALGGAQRLGMGATVSLFFFPAFVILIYFLTRRMLQQKGWSIHGSDQDWLAAYGKGNRQWGADLMFLWTAIPFYWMFVTSLKHDKEIYGYEATLIPERPTIANYVTIIKDTPICSFSATVLWWRCAPRISIIIASLGAYAIARLNFPGRNMARLLVCILVPASLLFIPLFALMSMLPLDSLSGLTFVYLGADVPFATWLLMGYFRSVPVELEEAALVDGRNRITALIRVVLPVAMPAIVVVTFFAFTRAWNEFLYAYVFTSTNQAKTITTGLVNS